MPKFFVPIQVSYQMSTWDGHSLSLHEYRSIVYTIFSAILYSPTAGKSDLFASPCRSADRNFHWGAPSLSKKLGLYFPGLLTNK